jgi:hypothetical protein
MATLPKSRPLTVAALLARDQGLNLFCKCGHRTALLSSQIAKLAHPQTRLLDFKRRFRCTMCGRGGEDVRMRIFAVPKPLATSEAPRPRVRH